MLFRAGQGLSRNLLYGFMARWQQQGNRRNQQTDYERFRGSSSPPAAEAFRMKTGQWKTVPI